MADADATYDLLALDPLIAPLREGYDMTVGNRMKGMEEGAMDWSHRFIGTPAINLMLSIFAGSRINDSQCGLRAFHARGLPARWTCARRAWSWRPR